jgi:hypothetical protein
MKKQRFTVEEAIGGGDARQRGAQSGGTGKTVSPRGASKGSRGDAGADGDLGAQGLPVDWPVTHGAALPAVRG